jgi:two-component system OmpR family response regulator
MRELAAVVESLLRRLPPREAAADSDAAGGWVFYPARWQVRSPHGVLQSLTAAENRVLQALAEAAGQTVSRQALASVQGKPALDFDYRRLETTISRLRRKLDSGDGESPVRAARGQGYAFIDKIRIES